jgi:hypothetical protein
MVQDAQAAARRSSTYLTLLAYALCANGCEFEAEHGTTIVSSAIVSGEPSPAADDSVVLLLAFDGDRIVQACSGVVVAKDLLLTARHCVSVVFDGPFRCDDRGLSLYAGASGQFGADRAADSLKIIFGMNRPPSEPISEIRPLEVRHDQSRVICNNDLASLVFEGDMPSVPISIAARVPMVGDRVRVVGWGRGDNGLLSDIRRSRWVIVTAVGPQPPKGFMTALGTNELATGEAVCDGDSGGALLNEEGELVAIASRGIGDDLEPRGPACFGADAQSIFTILPGNPSVATLLASANQNDAGSRSDHPSTGCATARNVHPNSLLFLFVVVFLRGRSARGFVARQKRARCRIGAVGLLAMVWATMCAKRLPMNRVRGAG